MKNNYRRRQFIRTLAAGTVGLGIASDLTSAIAKPYFLQQGRIGIIGLDTSHSTAFTGAFNGTNAPAELNGYKVVAAYPKGSNDIESSVKRIPGYIEEVKALGVEIVNSIKDLLDKVDFVLLETNDGRLHLEQAIQVIKAGKPMFIDKPISASLEDGISILETAEKYRVPVFSSSSLRFMQSVQDVLNGKAGKVLGADACSPCHLEKTHPDLFWYGIHGVETLYSVMGTGCKNVVRVHTEDTDFVVGTWEDGRIGTFRGTRSGENYYGGMVYGDKANIQLGPYDGYLPLLLKIAGFFKTGILPVSHIETVEILTFMEAADESKRQGGVPVRLEDIMKKAVDKN